eukprot:3242161-Ditylum_brightwellii.AAC.1
MLVGPLLGLLASGLALTCTCTCAPLRAPLPELFLLLMGQLVVLITCMIMQGNASLSNTLLASK